jgi:hypothetical protein
MVEIPTSSYILVGQALLRQQTVYDEGNMYDFVLEYVTTVDFSLYDLLMLFI